MFVAKKQASKHEKQEAFQLWAANINLALGRGETFSAERIDVLIKAGAASTDKTEEELKQLLDEKGVAAPKSEQLSASAGKYIGVSIFLILMVGLGFSGIKKYANDPSSDVLGDFID